MSVSLVIVESPAKVSKIQGFLGKDYIVKASFGHCYQINPKSTSIDIDNNFEPHYVAAEKKSKVIAELKEAAKKCDMVYIASDPDREGEAIGWHIAKFIIKDIKKIKRVTFHEITKSAVLSAFSNATILNEPMYHAQQARAVIDRLVGYEVSPVLWKKVCKGTSAGRVQSIGLKLIVDRQKEIDAFIPEEYWSIAGSFLTVNGDPFSAVYQANGKIKLDIQAKDILDSIKAQKIWKIASVDKQIKNRHPTPLFNTATLQQFAATNFGWTGKKTMSVAQSIYEAGLCVLPDDLIINIQGEILSAEEAVNNLESNIIGFTKFKEGSNFLTIPTEVYGHQKIYYKGKIRKVRTLDGQEIGSTQTINT